VSSVFYHLEELGAVLKRTPFGLITDVDGTISQIAPQPDAAMVSVSCRESLSVLSGRIALVAAVSGRRAIDARDMVGVKGMVYVGNHGLEILRDDFSEVRPDVQSYVEIVKSAIKELAAVLDIEGLFVENKGVTASIHYRRCPEPSLAQRLILKAIHTSAQAGKLRITQEKMAIGLLPPVAMNKGTAVQDLIQGYNLRGGIYLGDDLTDVDAFRAVHNATAGSDFRGLAVGVTGPETPEELLREADYTLKGLSDVERFLEWVAKSAALLS